MFVVPPDHADDEVLGLIRPQELTCLTLLHITPDGAGAIWDIWLSRLAIANSWYNRAKGRRGRLVGDQ